VVLGAIVRLEDVEETDGQRAIGRFVNSSSRKNKAVESWHEAALANR
jgi:hypothetical protein